MWCNVYHHVIAEFADGKRGKRKNQWPEKTSVGGRWYYCCLKAVTKHCFVLLFLVFLSYYVDPKEKVRRRLSAALDPLLLALLFEDGGVKGGIVFNGDSEKALRNSNWFWTYKCKFCFSMELVIAPFCRNSFLKASNCSRSSATCIKSFGVKLSRRRGSSKWDKSGLS